MKAAALLLALLAACGPPPCGPRSAKVETIVDGDTVDLEGGQRIRLLLVDTPEITGGKMDCYGSQAALFTGDALLGKQVSLTYDTACTDARGRTLAYITVDGRDFNAELVSKGYACTLFVAPSGESRKTEFQDLESVAKTNRVGLWGACTTVTCG